MTHYLEHVAHMTSPEAQRKWGRACQEEMSTRKSPLPGVVSLGAANEDGGQQRERSLTPASAIITKTSSANSWGDVEKGGPQCTAGRKGTGAATMKKSMELPQKIKNRTTI